MELPKTLFIRRSRASVFIIPYIVFLSIPYYKILCFWLKPFFNKKVYFVLKKIFFLAILPLDFDILKRKFKSTPFYFVKFDKKELFFSIFFLRSFVSLRLNILHIVIKKYYYYYKLCFFHFFIFPEYSYLRLNTM